MRKLAEPVVAKKRCTLCRKTKPLSKFHRQAIGKHGRTSRCQDCISTYQKQLRTPEYYRAQFLRLRYGVSVSEYEHLLKRQGGKCAICRSGPDRGSHLFVDHCHSTGVIRGLLCNSCNLALAWADWYGKYQRRIVSYLGG